MAETLATIEIAIDVKDVGSKTLNASLTFDRKNGYVVLIRKPDGVTESTTITSEAQGPANAWLLERLKLFVDQFDPNTSTVKVVSDPLNLLPKITYRCPNPQCHAKLFESWGSAPGIRIVCRKCKTLGIPQRGGDIV